MGRKGQGTTWNNEQDIKVNSENSYIYTMVWLFNGAMVRWCDGEMVKWLLNVEMVILWYGLKIWLSLGQGREWGRCCLGVRFIGCGTSSIDHLLNMMLVRRGSVCSVRSNMWHYMIFLFPNTWKILGYLILQIVLLWRLILKVLLKKLLDCANILRYNIKPWI